MHSSLIDGLSHLPQLILIMPHPGEGACYHEQHLCGILQALPWHNLNLAHCLHILLRVCANLLGIGTELVLIRRCRQNLAAQDGTNLLAIYNNRRTKIIQACMALIQGRTPGTGSSLTAIFVALLAAAATLRSATGVLHAKLRPIRRTGNRLAIRIHSNGSHTYRSRKVILELLQEIHIKHIFYANIFCHNNTPLPNNS